MKIIKDNLAKRAMLSVAGKAIISIILGVPLAFILMYRTCNKRTPLSSAIENNISQKIIEPIANSKNVTLNDSNIHGRFILLNNQNIDSLIEIIHKKTTDGYIVRQTSHKLIIDSLLDGSNYDTVHLFAFKIISVKSKDFYVVTKNDTVKRIFFRQ